MFEGVREVQSQLQQLRMAKQAEMGVGDLLKLMMEMNNKQEEDRQKRDARLAEEARVREEERRAEDERREERRELREQQFREETQRREAKLLVALKEAQRVVPQTVHISGTHFWYKAPEND